MINILILTNVLCLFFLIAYRINVKKQLSKYNTPIRNGYYSRLLTVVDNVTKEELDFESIVYVNEIDRYTNGESKIKIYKIEPGINKEKCSKEKIERYINDKFKSIIKTADITWLESEQSIKDIRRKKLEQLRKKI